MRRRSALGSRGLGEADEAGTALVCKLCSVLLTYPPDLAPARLDDVRDALPAVRAPRARARLARFTGWLRRTEPGAAAEHYVSVFDHHCRAALHLTYYRHGDTRARGMALLALTHAYRSAGLEPPADELPDHLAVLLEFAALAPGHGHHALRQCRSGLELLGTELRDLGSPYADVVDTVRGLLPVLSPARRAELRRLAADGPPVEDVGLEPFAPPEYLAGEHR